MNDTPDHSYRYINKGKFQIEKRVTIFRFMVFKTSLVSVTSSNLIRYMWFIKKFEGLRYSEPLSFIKISSVK